MQSLAVTRSTLNVDPPPSRRPRKAVTAFSLLRIFGPFVTELLRLAVRGRRDVRLRRRVLDAEANAEAGANNTRRAALLGNAALSNRNQWRNQYAVASFFSAAADARSTCLSEHENPNAASNLQSPYRELVPSGAAFARQCSRTDW